MNAFWRSIIIVILLAAMPMGVIPAAGQDEGEGGRLVLGTPAVDDFPTVRFRLDAYDPDGGFISDLKAGDLQILEDEQPLRALTIDQIDNAVQIVVALNLGPSLANKVNGQSEYERIQAGLSDWARAQSGKLDDFSLATQTGLFLIRSNEPAKWVKAIQDYQPDLVRAQPSLSSLAEALDLATDPLSNPLMKRSILYVTTPLTTQNYATIPDLTSRARETGARVNVWLLAPAPAGGVPIEKNPLQELAEATGGQFAQIAPETALPDLDALLKPLRGTYQISYTSGIQKSGVHSLKVRLEAGGSVSNTSSFELTVQPPNPIFLSPPASIERTWTQASNNVASVLAPDEVQLQILIEFPDQHQRPLEVTRLYVNDTLVDENRESPFDRFTWPVGSLTQAGKQLLRVEVVDSLGLTGASLDTPVEVLIEQQQAARPLTKVSSSGMIAVGAVVLSGGVLALVLVLTSQRRQGRRKHSQADANRNKDPLTQPVPIRQDNSQPRKASTPVPSQPTQPKAAAWSTSAWPGPGWLKPGSANAPARLVALDENEQPLTGGWLPLVRQEITFGSDPRRATQLLESPTVDGLHARLYRNAEGDFFLADQGSVAGTWINYAPVTDAGMQLEHGDLIHIGRAMFRFERLETGRPAAEIKVTNLDKQP